MLLWCNTWNLNGVYISFGGGGWTSVVDCVYLLFTVLHIHSVKNLGHSKSSGMLLPDVNSIYQVLQKMSCMNCACHAGIIVPSKCIFM
jgi:hypothetical protein